MKTERFDKSRRQPPIAILRVEALEDRLAPSASPPLLELPPIELPPEARAVAAPVVEEAGPYVESVSPEANKGLQQAAGNDNNVNDHGQNGNGQENNQGSDHGDLVSEAAKSVNGLARGLTDNLPPQARPVKEAVDTVADAISPKPQSGGDSPIQDVLDLLPPEADPVRQIVDQLPEPIGRGPDQKPDDPPPTDVQPSSDGDSGNNAGATEPKNDSPGNAGGKDTDQGPNGGASDNPTPPAPTPTSPTPAPVDNVTGEANTDLGTIVPGTNGSETNSPNNSENASPAAEASQSTDASASQQALRDSVDEGVNSSKASAAVVTTGGTGQNSNPATVSSAEAARQTTLLAVPEPAKATPAANAGAAELPDSADSTADPRLESPSRSGGADDRVTTEAINETANQTPQSADVMSNIMPFDMAGLNSAMQQFMEQVDDFSSDLVAVLEESGLFPWFMVAGAVAYEVNRRRRKRNQSAKTTTARPERLSSTWFPGSPASYVEA